MARRRNTTLDVLRLLAAYMVVSIHVMFYGLPGVAVDALARFAVPFFFLVSGYYACDASPQVIRRRAGQILKLLLTAVAAYSLYRVLVLCLQGDLGELARYFGQYLVSEKLLKLILLNVPVQTEHLWYLPAMVYVYLLYYAALVRGVPERVLHIAAVAGVLLHLFLGEGLSAFGILVPIPLLRNFALMGFPFFGLGLLAAKHKGALCRVPTGWIWACAAAGMAESLLSRYFFGKNELYLGSVLMLFALTVVFVKFPHRQYPAWLLAAAECGTGIYLFHPMVSGALVRALGLFGIDLYASAVLQMIHPLTVCLLTTLLARAFVRGREKRRQREPSPSTQ